MTTEEEGRNAQTEVQRELEYWIVLQGKDSLDGIMGGGL